MYGEKYIKVPDFIKKYTLDGIRGFDFHELEEIINKSQKQYPDKKIILNKMNYDGLNGAPECYYKACSNFDELGISICDIESFKGWY